VFAPTAAWKLLGHVTGLSKVTHFSQCHPVHTRLPIVHGERRSTSACSVDDIATASTRDPAQKSLPCPSASERNIRAEMSSRMVKRFAPERSASTAGTASRQVRTRVIRYHHHHHHHHHHHPYSPRRTTPHCVGRTCVIRRLTRNTVPARSSKQGRAVAPSLGRRAGGPG